VAITTTPFCLSSTGVGSEELGAEVVRGRGFAGEEVPTPATAALAWQAARPAFSSSPR